MSTGTVDWDGAFRIGPVRLGMTGTELKAVLPGYVEVPTDLASRELAKEGFAWEAEEFGLSVTVDREVVVSVHATLEFLHEGADLIGLPVPAALWRLGGAVSREGGEIEIIQTAIGAELYCRADHVVGVSVSRWELVQE